MLKFKNANKGSASILVLIFVAGLLVGGLLMFYATYRQVSNLNSEINDLQTAVAGLQGFQNATNQEITILQNGTSIAELYANLRDSAVLIQGTTNTASVQGSGFVYNYAGKNVILTNYHVVEDTITLSVTFSNGKGYSATVVGTDPYADLAVVSVKDAPEPEFKPVTIVKSSSLRVGEPVIAIGNPYGLVGSLTTGVVSATGRSINVNTAGSFSIANVIQTSAPINPGNSGGMLLNSLGNVVGITTAIVSDSQGLGFAIPSNTILREIGALINTGSYNGHSYLGVTGRDMSYSLAQETGATVTYGWKIASIVRNGPSDGKLVVGDIIIAMNNQTIKNNDDLASYLEENTLPNDNIRLTVIRNNEEIEVTIKLGTRPAP
ncbi:MAG: trypsin-like peptidase domain-containing protein [Candidatus Bathyarchaeia archaeon]|nr:trypsin-like peptidase domain-containing protein [Thermoproteota archaeon]NLD66590.1 PDZ domain-containing protein [Thermoproteota archaeon]